MEKEILNSYHTVSSYELDSFGHVNNAVFMNFLEKARCDYMTQRGLDFSLFHKWQLFPVVVKAALQFRRPALAGDRLNIQGWLTHHTRIGFTLKYQIIDTKTGALLLDAETSHAFINEKNRPSRMPEEFLEKFIRGAGSSEEKLTSKKETIE